MRLHAAVMAVLLLAGCASAPPKLPQPSGPTGQILSIPFDPADAASPVLSARLCLPQETGPHPVAILTQGSAASPELRGTLQAASCDSPSVRWFTGQKYAAVSLLRRGFGASTGPAVEDNGPCVAPDYLRSARLGAEDIEAALRAALSMPWAKPEGALVVGQSTGGWAGLGVAALNDPRLRAVIVFAAGRGAKVFLPPNSVCRPDLLVDAARELGRKATTPVLWILARNDTYFPRDISAELHRAYTQEGAPAEFALVNVFFDEGHALYNAPGGSDVWGPIVQNFLSRLPSSTVVLQQGR